MLLKSTGLLWPKQYHNKDNYDNDNIKNITQEKPVNND